MSFFLLRNRKMICVNRSHQKLSIMQFATHIQSMPWPKAIVQGRARKHNLFNVQF